MPKAKKNGIPQRNTMDRYLIRPTTLPTRTIAPNAAESAIAAHAAPSELSRSPPGGIQTTAAESHAKRILDELKAYTAKIDQESENVYNLLVTMEINPSIFEDAIEDMNNHNETTHAIHQNVEQNVRHIHNLLKYVKSKDPSSTIVVKIQNYLDEALRQQTHAKKAIDYIRNSHKLLILTHIRHNIFKCKDDADVKRTNFLQAIGLLNELKEQIHTFSVAANAKWVEERRQRSREWNSKMETDVNRIKALQNQVNGHLRDYNKGLDTINTHLVQIIDNYELATKEYDIKKIQKLERKALTHSKYVEDVVVQSTYDKYESEFQKIKDDINNMFALSVPVVHVLPISNIQSLIRTKFNKLRQLIERTNIFATTQIMSTYLFYWDVHFSYMRYNGYSLVNTPTGVATMTADTKQQYNSSAKWTRHLETPRTYTGEDGRIQDIKYAKQITETQPYIYIYVKDQSSLSYHKYVQESLNNKYNTLIRHPGGKNADKITLSVNAIKAVNYEANHILLSLKDDGNIFNVHPLLYTQGACIQPFTQADGAVHKIKVDPCVCHLCGNPIQIKLKTDYSNNTQKTGDFTYLMEQGQLDHIIPYIMATILGVLNTPLNYAYTHDACNSKKSDQTIAIPSTNNDNPYQVLEQILMKAGAISGTRNVPSKSLSKRKSPKTPSKSLYRNASLALDFCDKQLLLQPKNAHNIFKLYTYAWLKNYFRLILSGYKPRQKGGSTCDLSPSDDPALYPYMEFLKQFESAPSREGCLTACSTRAIFMKNRMESLFLFSWNYAQIWWTTRGEQEPFSYPKFLETRVDMLNKFQTNPITELQQMIM